MHLANQSGTVAQLIISIELRTARSISMSTAIVAEESSERGQLL